MELLVKLTPTIKVLKSVIHQKQVIADSSGQAATVWDLGGQPAKEAAREYDQLYLSRAFSAAICSASDFVH